MGESSFHWQENLCREQKAAGSIFVIFGASGDLSKRKLFPSLFALFRRGLMDEQTRLIGCARHGYDTVSFRAEIASVLPADADRTQRESFLDKITYHVLDYEREEDFRRLAGLLPVIPPGGTLIHYLALPSVLYLQTVRNLSVSGLLKEDPSPGRKCQVVFEKPFGSDLASFRVLDEGLKQYLSERQIYRIDHYLGKETVQNIFLLRFANRIFEDLWDRDHIDSIQITAAETLGVEKRAGYFDQAGILQDMFQNHMLEMLALAVMDCPREFSGDAVRDEKVKLIRSIARIDPEYVVRGQYRSYQNETGVRTDSPTETFAAMRLFIDSRRWAQVPIYLRAGKKLSCRKTQIDIVFKRIPFSIFPGIRKEDLQQNILHLYIQPQEGMGLTLQAKKEGPKLCMGALTLCYEHGQRSAAGLDAYARLLLDCQLNDQTLFSRSDVIDASWQLFQELQEFWKRNNRKDLFIYDDGSRGPEKSISLLHNDNRKWILDLTENDIR